MTDPSSEPDTPAGTGQPAGTPRWVKVLGLLVLLMVLLVAVLHLTGNSMGGHGSHLGSAAWGTGRP
jgi:hypothetical protein